MGTTQVGTNRRGGHRLYTELSALPLPAVAARPSTVIAAPGFTARYFHPGARAKFHTMWVIVIPDAGITALVTPVRRQLKRLNCPLTSLQDPNPRLPC